MKKLIAMLLCLTMVLSLLVACGGNSNEATEGNGNDGGTTTITIGIPQDVKVVPNYDENAYTKWLEKESGYEIEFVPFSGSDPNTQLAVSILNDSEKLPDILWGFKSLGSGTWSKYGDQGYFIDLKDYFDDKEGAAKTWWDRASQLPEAYVDMVLRRCTADDGGMYAFPRIEYTEIDTMDYMVFINQEWLTKLNLSMPTDKDSLYNVLKAFRDGDPNGNGQKDEKPLVGGEGVISWIINMFVPFNDNKLFGLSEDGQTITTPFAEDKYREALIFLRKLYDEGLMVNCFSIQESEISSMFNPEGENVVGIGQGHPTLDFNVGGKSVYAYTAVPYWGYAIRNENQNTYCTFITADAEDPDACWDLLMLMSSEEGAMRQRYGEYGVDWNDADAGAKSYLGYDATYKIVKDDAFSGINGQTYHSISATILIGAENEYAQYDETLDKWLHAKNGLIRDIYNNFNKAEKENNPKYMMPVIYYTQEQTEETQFESMNVKSVINSYRMKFATGVGGLDPSSNSDWNIYLGELKDQGLEKWQSQVQSIYEQDGYKEAVMSGNAYI